MLYFSRWKSLGILLTAVILCLLAVPNFFSDTVVKRWPAWAPHQVELGIDLQGGTHMLLEVDDNDVRLHQLSVTRDEVRRVLREAGVQLSRASVIRGNAVEVRIRDFDFQRGLAKIRELSQPLAGALGAAGRRPLDIEEGEGGLIRVVPTEAAILERTRQVVEQSVQMVGRRVNVFGLVEPLIERQGHNRILIQLPGFDVRQLPEFMIPSGTIAFRFVDAGMTAEQALQGGVAPTSEIVYGTESDGKPLYLLEKRVIISGEEVVDARPGLDHRTGAPIVKFWLDTFGARKFAQVSTENIGRQLAIKFDGEVISAPVIRGPVVSGAGQISGSFTVESANNLATLLRAGVLPARLAPVEERVVAAGLGLDLIKEGKTGYYLGAALVVMFMVVSYGLFGVLAGILIAVNVGMIFGVLSLFHATLTVPGIVGVVLTIGIAVHSHVLIYERIREEVRAGRSVISAIDAGFACARSAVLGSSIAIFVVAAALFVIGTGSVRSLAVTLGIGMITTVFTAFTLTRLVIAWWAMGTHPQQLAIS